MADLFHTMLATENDETFGGVTFLFNDEIGEYGGIGYWSSKERALAAVQTYLPQLRKMLEYSAQWEPVVQVFDVYQPKLL